MAARTERSPRHPPGVAPDPTVVERIRRYVNGDSGVSPVVGVILLVAITVMLVAVMGAIFMGLGQQLSAPAPTTSLTVQDASFYYGSLDAEDDPFSAPVFVVSHEGGDEVAMGDVRITVRDPDSGAVLHRYGGEDDSPWNAVPAVWPHPLVGDKPDNAVLQVNGQTPTAETEFGVGDSITIVDTDNSAAHFNANFVRFKKYHIQVVHLPSESTMVEKTVMLY